MKILLFILILFSAAGAQDLNTPLRDELLKMLDVDQQRQECAKGNGDEQIKCLAEISEKIDKPNTKRLEEIFNQYGFPTAKLVGREGVGAFMTILQHAPTDDLRVKSFKPIKKAFRRKEITPSEYAGFVDRLRLHQGKPQLYGQGFSFKEGGGKMTMDAVVDPKNLDKRRKKIGLPPIAESVKILEEMYHLKVEIPKIH
ncbi:MAG: hypothetical protein M3033_12035 [Acidobacteriota bacterium]|nr:hypothetical protein [Acidobacteriota bacterium]